MYRPGSLTLPTCFHLTRDTIIEKSSPLQLFLFGASERGRLGSLRFRHDIRPQAPVRQIVVVEELRGAAVIEPYFLAAAGLNGFVPPEVYAHSAHLVLPSMR